jgi:RimJ/RimL family protein N-acetyltransferase
VISADELESILTVPVQLRAVTTSDLSVFYAQQDDPEANARAAFPARSEDAFMAHWTRILADASVTARTILYGDDVAGNVVTFEQLGLRHVGYWIGRPYWGKGIATRALSDFLAQEPARPLYAHVAKHNSASIRVLEKCGFAVCGEDTVTVGSGGEEVEELIFRLGPDSP